MGEQAFGTIRVGNHRTGEAHDIEFALVEGLDHGGRRAEAADDHDRHPGHVADILGEVYEVSFTLDRALPTPILTLVRQGDAHHLRLLHESAGEPEKIEPPAIQHPPPLDHPPARQTAPSVSLSIYT